MIVKTKISFKIYKFFLLFVCLFYVVPFFTYIFFNDNYSLTFQKTDYIYPIFLVLPIFPLIFLGDVLLPRIKFHNSLFFLFGRVITSKSFNLALSGLFLLTALYFFYTFSISFRHKVALSDAGIIATVLFFFRAYFKAYTLVFFLSYLRGNVNIGESDRITMLFVGASFILSLNAANDILWSIIPVGIVLKKEKIFFQKRTLKHKTLRVKIFQILLIVVLIITALFIGTANKFGVDTTIRLFTDYDLMINFLLKYVKRLSVWFVSIITSGVAYFNGDIELFKIYSGMFQNTIFRLGVLLNIDLLDKPEMFSVNRANFIHLFQPNSLKRAGTSPNILASIFYIPFFPVGILVMANYVIYVLRKLSSFVNSSTPKFSPLIAFVFLFYMIGFFESPLNYLNIFEPSLYAFLFTIGGINYLNYKNAN